MNKWEALEHTTGKKLDQYWIVDPKNAPRIAIIPADRENAKANAQLIASAPELLEALEGLFKECAMIHKYGGSICNQNEADLAISQAKEAIDRATNV